MLLREQGRDRSPMIPQPGLGAEADSVLRSQRRFDAENRVGFLIRKLRHGPDEMRTELAANFFRQPSHFLIQRTVAELEIVERDQLFDMIDREGDPDGDADCADRKQFDDPFHANRTQGPMRSSGGSRTICGR